MIFLCDFHTIQFLPLLLWFQILHHSPWPRTFSTLSALCFCIDDHENISHYNENRVLFPSWFEIPRPTIALPAPLLTSPDVVLKVIVLIENNVFPLLSLSFTVATLVFCLEPWGRYFPQAYPLRLASLWIISRFSTSWAACTIWARSTRRQKSTSALIHDSKSFMNVSSTTLSCRSDNGAISSYNWFRYSSTVVCYSILKNCPHMDPSLADWKRMSILSLRFDQPVNLPRSSCALY